MNIAMNLKGGLCNMMFQVATGESLAKDNWANVYYPNLLSQFFFLKREYGWTEHCQEYLSMFKNFKWGTDRIEPRVDWIVKKMPFNYWQIDPKDCDYFDGYFQSERFFPDRQFVLNLFKPSRKVLATILDKYESILDGTTCSIHVRRGNYCDLQDHHVLLDMEYYNKAIWTLNPFKVKKFLVFSNDLEWCKKNFLGDKFIFISDIDYIEMFLMSTCTHHIIANSAFSWWGAWLGEQDDCVTIAPIKWFPDNKPDARDIVPIRWIKL
jgi:hypothetical protein